MKIIVFTPREDDFSEIELDSDVVPPEGSTFKYEADAGLDYKVKDVIYVASEGKLVPQIWLTANRGRYNIGSLVD